MSKYSRRDLIKTSVSVLGGTALGGSTLGCHRNERVSHERSIRSDHEAKMISIKPHHFIDIITSFGTGQRTFQPHSYGHDVHTVSQRILDNCDTILIMELGADDICKPCVHNVNGVCDDTIDTSYRPQAPPSKNAWNLLIDQRWCERLEIRQGDRFSARDLCRRIRDRMGDITDIYREIPADRTKTRQTNLSKGLEYYLEHRT